MKWVWRLLGLVVLLIVLAVGALFLVPTERIAAIATDRFEAATGRALVIEGDVRPTLWPVLGVTTGAFLLENADWAGPEPMVEAAGISVGIDPGTIFGDIRVTGIEIREPVIRLATGADGTGNWAFGEAGSAPAAGAGGGGTGASRALTLDAARITGGTVIFTPADGTTVRLDDIDLTAGFPDSAGPVTLAMAARMGEAAFSGEAEVVALSELLAGGTSPLQAALTLGSAEVALDGILGLQPAALDGALRASASDLARVFAALGQPAPDLPRGLGRDRMEATALVAFEDETLSVADLDLTLDENRVQGVAQVRLGGARPVVQADLNLGNFDLGGVETGGGAETNAAGATTGWSTEPFDVSALGLIDGRIGVTASGLRLGTSTIGALATETVIEDRRAVTEIARLQAYDGSAAGTLVLNGRDGFSTRLDIAGSAFAISRLLSELVGYDRIVAAGDLQLDVLGVGNSMDRLMNSLNGNGAFRVGAGELLGLDIAGMLRNLDPSYVGQGHTTIFDEISGTFRIVDGVVINDDLRLTAPLFRATGSGRIGIGGQTLDLSVVPELLGGENAGLKVPLRVTGSWDNPRVRLDIEGAIRERVETEVRERVEKEVKERVEDELKDAVEGGLEDVLKKGLGGLLNR
ncbi:AsmA family protein [Ovoidimarina sediminis]|uniref:AsmA family protein n=1 Tax=Ovoidimarina sediminis TaxID=3079856 RepID=UPI002906909B|nr:AsmA-like C-terminal region-containing protein [Rhodophyticola sp. MJ-SS7]MDU8945060.1 AsmA-like C-terminal region-containing protein [Rhodophyticola sp. MJ-SS7]